MKDFLHRWADTANDAANIGWLLIAVVTVLILAGVGVAFYYRKTRRRTIPRPGGYSIAVTDWDPFEGEREVYPPIRMEQLLREELGSEADRYPTDDVLNGMVEDWRDKRERDR